MDDDQEKITPIKVLYNIKTDFTKHSARRLYDENKYRNRLVDTRFALLRTMKSSNGFLPISVPVDKVETEPSFIFANEKSIPETQATSLKPLRPSTTDLTSPSKQGEFSLISRIYNR
jgi:hypothetical protein